MAKETASPSPADRRTFDCPWCGAIHVVPQTFVGTLFTCGECRQETRLTPQNLSNRPPTEPPGEVPDDRPRRVFDCPWCGAISTVTWLQMGTHFHCPECHRGTKLTDVNTRASAVTEAAPDAPHVMTAAERRRRALLVVGAVLVLGGVVAFAFLGPGDEGGDAGGEMTTAGSEATEATTAPTEEPADDEGGEAMASTDAETERAARLAAARERLTQAEEQLRQAGQRRDMARAAVAAWTEEHPEVDELAPLRPVSAAAVAWMEQALGAMGPAREATPEAARSFNAAFRSWLQAERERYRFAERVHARLVAEPGPRPRPPVEDWRGLNLFAPDVREALRGEATALGVLPKGPPEALIEALEAAEAAWADAAAERQEAQAALEALGGA